MSDRNTGASPHGIVVVTGPAGAGRTTAIHALEDFGYEAIDNLPMTLFSRLLDGPPLDRPLAIGVDPRTRGFSIDALKKTLKRGTPTGLDMMMDLRFLRNPHWEEKLRPLNGQDPAVGRYVKEDPLYEPFLKQFTEITILLLPAYKAEGKSYFSLGLGCTGGQHRSVFVTEVIANTLAEKGWQVSIRHRELERGERLEQLSLRTGVV